MFKTCEGIYIIESINDCCEIIERYGKQIFMALYVDGLINMSVPNDDTLLEHGFNKRCLSVVRANIKRGKYMTHLNKYNGKVKKKYYGYTICTIVNEMEITQKPENKRILKRMIEIAYEAYQSRYRKQFKGIELDIDPITCDIITDAVYIKIDWDNNCKIVYSLDTLTKCIATNRKYIGYDIDERGNTFYVYKDEPLGYYISPYTKMKFYKYDIIKVNTKMLKS